MNKTRRKELTDVINGLNEMQDKDDLYSWINDLENIKDDEEYYYDNIPENLQSSQRACDSEEAIDNLNEAISILNDAYDEEDINDAIKMIPEAIEYIERAQV